MYWTPFWPKRVIRPLKIMDVYYKIVLVLGSLVAYLETILFTVNDGPILIIVNDTYEKKMRWDEKVVVETSSLMH